MLISESSIVNDSLLSIILVSGGLVSLIVTVLGIKLRWFRHRLTFDEPVDNSLLNSHGSSFEIRESCARGLYRQTLDDQLLESFSRPVFKQRTSQTNNRESIFRWPFRSKFQLAHKLNIQEEKGTISTLQSAATSSYEHEYNVELREKNEKLKKMISERISTENTSAKKKKQYREVSVDRDEPAKNVQQIPLPLKRTSLEVTKELIPPVVKPRTIIHIDSKDDDLIENSHEYVTKITSETVDNPEQIQVIEETPVSEQKLPKSILKNSDTNSNLKKIKFQEVSAVITSSESGSDTDDSSDNYEEDTWNLVDQHRNALNRKDISSSSPPPLPTSSPPSLAMAEQSNNYSFA